MSELRPLPLRVKLIGALELKPMTVAELCRVVSCDSYGYVDNKLRMLEDAGVTRVHARATSGLRTGGRPENIWALTTQGATQ